MPEQMSGDAENQEKRRLNNSLRGYFCQAFGLNRAEPIEGRAILVHDTIDSVAMRLNSPGEETFVLQGMVTEHRLASVSFYIVKLNLSCAELPATRQQKLQKLVIAFALHDAPRFLVRVLSLQEGWETGLRAPNQQVPLAALHDGWGWFGDTKRGQLDLKALLSARLDPRDDPAPLSIEIL